MSRSRRGRGKGSQYSRKTRSAFKQGYLDRCTPLDSNSMSKLSLNDTYVDVYSGLKPWERLGTMGYYSLETNMCEIDRKNLQKGINKLKEMTDDRSISITEEREKMTLTEEVMRRKREASRKRKSDKGKGRERESSKKRQSPPRDLVSVASRERELTIKEKELVGRFHPSSVGKSIGEHAPIPYEGNTTNLLRDYQHQNIVSFPTHSKIESFIFRAQKCWKSQWNGKNILAFFLIQTQCVNLPLHGLSVRFAGVSSENDDSLPVYLDMSISYKIDQHARYFVCINLECKAPLNLANIVVEYEKGGEETHHEFSKYVSKYGNKQDISGIIETFSQCYISKKSPTIGYYTCTCL